MRGLAIPTFVPAITLLAAVAVLGLSGSASPQIAGASSAGSPQTDFQAQHPTEAEIRARTKNVTDNQHRNDQALEQYERVERYVDRSGGANPRTIEDHTYRVVPDGGGTVKLLLKDGDTPADPAEYHRQLQLLESILEIMVKPGDSRANAIREKYEKRKQERTQFVDAASEAYNAKWVGIEMYAGRKCDVIELDPTPNFHPHSMFQAALAHVSAKVWIDHQADQIVRGEAHVLSDISFGGGILGKLYRGGVISMDQAEVAPGIWLPTRTQYDFSGRKFLFSFEEHQTIDASHYRRIGPPEDALATIRNELSTGKPFTGDP
jgi:hypothetical protein